MNGLGELMPGRCWQSNSPSNSFQSISLSLAVCLHMSREETGQWTCDEVHRFPCHWFSFEISTLMISLFMNYHRHCFHKVGIEDSSLIMCDPLSNNILATQIGLTSPALTVAMDTCHSFSICVFLWSSRIHECTFLLLCARPFKSLCMWVS